MYLNREHPIRTVFDLAVSHARLPSKDQLDTWLNRGDLPEGADIARFRRRITSAATEIAELSKRGLFNQARQLSDDYVTELALEMTDDERHIDRTDPTPAESSADIAARMFGH